MNMPAAYQFDRTLAKHLAARIAEGAICDEPVVRQCCSQTRQELRLLPYFTHDRYVSEVESLFVQSISSLIETHQRFISHMPEVIAGPFIADLLCELGRGSTHVKSGVGFNR